jgi:hypothetical protein
MGRLRGIALISVGMAATGCLETHAPPERAPYVPPLYDEVTIDPTHGFAPVVLLEGGTGIHVVYIAEAFPDWGGPYPLAYGGCAGGCEFASHWRTGAFDSILGNLPPAAVLAGGALHVVYPVFGPVFGRSRMVLRYASCEAGCDAPANWLRTDIDSALYVQPALAAGTSGTLQLIYARSDSTARVLRYASCAAACTVASNWLGSTIDTDLAVHAVPSMASGPNGDLHVVFTEAGDSQNAPTGRLWYGACPSGCASRLAWQFVALDSGSPLSAPSLVVEAGTTVLVSYSAGYSDTRIATCRSACRKASSWAIDTLVGFGSGPKLATGLTDTVYLVATGPPLRFAACSGDCDLASDWSRSTLGDGVGPSIVVDLAGHPRVAFEGVFTLRMALFR